MDSKLIEYIKDIQKNCPEYDKVAEFEDAYMFYESKNPYTDGVICPENREIVIRKSDGQYMSYSHYCMTTEASSKVLMRRSLKSILRELGGNHNVIILNRMYAGDYIQDKIGHEVINLFKDDAGDNYIYVNHDGWINSEYDNSIDAILLVKSTEKGVMEVIAKAEQLEQIAFKRNKNDNTQIEYVKNNNIRYGGVLLSDIYKDIGQWCGIVSFKTEKLRKVKKPIYLVEDEDKSEDYQESYVLPEKHFSSQSLKMYYDKALLPKDYDVLQKLIENDELWEEENTTTIIDQDMYFDTQNKTNFLSIIKKENDELVFSNILVYLFEQNRNLFVEFTKTVLGINSFSTKYVALRESHENIDIWIEDDNSVIIIENKIKSEINGVKKGSYGKVESQLVKYYEYGQKQGKPVFYYIFTPDYNTINLAKYKDGDKYTVIKYSQIYDFYMEHAGKMLYVNYFPEFLDGLKKHASTVDNANFDTMKERFLETIYKKNND